MVEKKTPAQNGGGAAGAADAHAGAKKTATDTEYTVSELAAAAASIFPGVSPDCVTAALRLAKVEKATKGRAQEIVKEFVSAPVAGPRKGGN